MNPDNNQNNTGSPVSPENVTVTSAHPVNQVTSFSKYLAMALFIVLPFVGGYIGYMYAPENVVETEEVTFLQQVTQESHINNIKTADTDSSGSETEYDYNSELVQYSNEVLGISFTHPSNWGNVVDIGSDTHIMLSFTNLSVSPGDSHFLSAKTVNYKTYGRGGYWGDMTQEMPESFGDSSLKIFYSNDTVKIYELENGEMGCDRINGKAYFISSNKNNLQPVIVLSDTRIATLDCTLRDKVKERQFEDMLRSIKYTD